MSSRVENIIAELKKSRRRYWFGTCWKPQNVADEEKYKGCPDYDKLDVMLRTFEASVSGVKWAYAIHNKGHNIDGWKHADCEHKHFVIVTENPISGSSMMKHFPHCHLEIVKMDVDNCARYLLHLTSSSIEKERISLDDLYCSGQGVHGEIWFPLITSQIYATFVPNECLHYVYNENMHSVIEFTSKFGSSVLHGAYGSIIRECLDIYARREVPQSFFLTIWKLCPDIVKDLVFTDYNISEGDKVFASDNELYNQMKLRPVGMHFTQLYIWWKNSTSVANPYLLHLMDMYGLQSLLKVNDDRLKLDNIIRANSMFGERDEDGLSVSEVLEGLSDVGETESEII